MGGDVVHVDPARIGAGNAAEKSAPSNRGQR
jgi:hypothetical protein